MIIIIRKARTEDAEAIADIKITGWQTAYRGIIDDDFLDNMNINEEIEKRKNNIKNGANIIVAELDNEIVGFCLYRDYIKNQEDNLDADCEISSLYVKPELKRKGIGKKLMNYVIDDLKSKEKKKMILGCLKDNYPSRAFYEKMGGKVLKTEKIAFGNKEYEEKIYEYKL